MYLDLLVADSDGYINSIYDQLKTFGKTSLKIYLIFFSPSSGGEIAGIVFHESQRFSLSGREC